MYVYVYMYIDGHRLLAVGAWGWRTSSNGGFCWRGYRTCVEHQVRISSPVLVIDFIHVYLFLIAGVSDFDQPTVDCATSREWQRQGFSARRMGLHQSTLK